MALPTGTVTFLFTDIEGSTRLLQQLGDRFRDVVERHNAIVDRAISGRGGVVVRMEGDSFFAAFERPADAVAAAVEAQRRLANEPWPAAVRVRMGIHTGEGVVGGGDYVGIDVHRAARIAAAGHGGQVLVSGATRALVEGVLPGGVQLRSLGEHRLRDLSRQMAIHDLAIAGLTAEFPPIRAADPPSTLPRYRTTFVGRERERSELAALLEPGRIVTVVGPGGMGKTRLAVEAAATVRERFFDGVHFVDLSAVTDPDVVPATIAAGLGLTEVADRTPAQVLREHLGNRTMLLVVDNLEQVLGAADLIDELSASSPTAAFLATSRESLGIPGEQRYPLEGLSEDAVRLFRDRVRMVDPRAAEGDEATIMRICERLDGLPLAIELAASRVPLRTLAGLAEELEDRLGASLRGPRSAPTRQRTLHDAIAWSYDLLDDRERRIFGRLPVFAGGWSLQALDRVVGEPASEVVDALIEKSLVRPPDDTGRFRMLATIRAFAAQRLAEDPDAGEVRRRHATFFVDLAEEAEPHLVGADARRWTDLLEAELENTRVALTWMLDAGDLDGCMRLTAAAWRAWQQRGYLRELRGWLDRILDHPGAAARTRSRAGAMGALGSVAYWQADDASIGPAYRESLDIYEQLGDEAGVAEATLNLAAALAVEGDLDGADAMLRRAGERYRGLGDDRGVGRALTFRSVMAHRRGAFEEACVLAREASDLLRSGGDHTTLSVARGTVGHALLELGDAGGARPLFLEQLELQLESGDLSGVALALYFLAGLAGRLGDHLTALRLGGASESLREAIGGATSIALSAMPDARVSAATTLDPPVIEAAYAEGRAMSMEEAVTLARRAI